jgi:nucleoside-diphosphate kinase
MLNDCYDLILGLKFLNVERAFAEKHYADLSAKPFFGGLVEYIVSGPVVAMIWEGKNVVLTGRKIIGATNPAQSEPGTIRGDFAIDIGRYIHVLIITLLLKHVVLFKPFV